MRIEEVLSSMPPAKWRPRQAIVLDWYDGPREGFCALERPLAEFRFTLVAERPTADDLDDRLLRVHELPVGSVDKVLAVLKPLGTPLNRIWIPVWKFPDDATQESAERFLTKLESEARPTNCVVWTRHMEKFLGLWTVEPHLMDERQLALIDALIPQPK